MSILKRKFFITIILIACIMSFGMFYVYFNVPLRTAIYRSVFRQTVYLTSDKDTLYSFGYFGVRKQLINRKDGSLSLLKENSTFCKNCFIGHLIGRSGIVHGNYLYVAARSYLGGRYISKDKNYLKGKFLIMRKSDLKIIKEIKSDYSMIETKIYDNYLVVTGLQGFNIYDIKEPINPKIIYSYRTDKPEEYQGCDFFLNKKKLYLAIARFDEGISIFRIDNSDVKRIKDIPIMGTNSSYGILGDGLHIFKLKIKYPYIYTTLAPKKENVGSKKDYRGIIVYNIDNMDNIKSYAVLIPRSYYYKTITGDSQPSYIDIYNNKIYVNFCEKGVAVFSLPVFKSKSEFIGLKDFSGGKMILPIYIDKTGTMFMGSFDNENIYSIKLN